MRATLVVIALCVTGCVSIQGPAASWVYPGAAFVSAGTEKPEHYRSKVEQWCNEFLNKPVTDAYWRGVLNYHFTNDLPRIKRDPFWTREQQHVMFVAPAMGKEIDMYFDSSFFRHGWSKYRGMFSVESTGAGPDYVSVYQKGDAFVKVHIFGPWDHPLLDPDGQGATWTNCNYLMSFVGIQPEQLLGKGYNRSEQQRP